MNKRKVYKRFTKKGETIHSFFKRFEKAIEDGTIKVTTPEPKDKDCINPTKKN